MSVWFNRSSGPLKQSAAMSNPSTPLAVSNVSLAKREDSKKSLAMPTAWTLNRDTRLRPVLTALERQSQKPPVAHSEFDDRVRPGQARAEGDEDDRVARLDPTGAGGLVQRDRDRRRRRVAVLVDVH